MNWRLTDRDVARANFGDANKMMETSTNTMNKGFDAATGAVDALSTMFDSRVLKTMLSENQRDLVERTQVQADYNRGIEQIVAENPDNPLAQEDAKNALIRDMRLQGGMENHQLEQLGLRQAIDPQNKVKYLQNRRTQLESELNMLNIDKEQQDDIINGMLRKETSDMWGSNAPLHVRNAGMNVGYANLGDSNFAADALASSVNGAAGSGTPGTAGGTGQPETAGATGQPGGAVDSASQFRARAEANMANIRYAGNPSSNAPGIPAGSTMTAERADNFRLQLHNSKNTDLINLDPTNVTTFADARRETRKLGEVEYEQEGRHLAFGPYQIIMGNVDAGTFERAGIEGGEDAPLTLENQRKLAFALGKERIQREGESDLDKTFLGLASRREEILKKLGVSDLKGSTLIEYAKEKYGHASESKNLDNLMADLEKDIIETEGSPGTLEAVEYMRAMEGQEDRNKDSAAVVEEMRKNQNSDMFFDEGDLNNIPEMFSRVSALLMEAQQAKSGLNALIGFPNYEQVSNDTRDIVDIIGTPEDNNVSWVDGKTHQEQVKNVTSMVRGIKSAAAEEGIVISNAEAFGLLKANYSSDWFGTDIGKKWWEGGGVDKAGSKALIKELKVGDIAKARHDLGVLNSAMNILEGGAVDLEKITKEMQKEESRAADLGYKRGLSPEQTKDQLLNNRKYKALDTERKRILGRMKNASSQVFNNPAYETPKNRVAREVAAAQAAAAAAAKKTGVAEGGGEDSPEKTTTQLIEELAKNNNSLKTLTSEPTEENKVSNSSALSRVHEIFKAIKKQTNTGQDVESYLRGDKLNSLKIIADMAPEYGSTSSSGVVSDHKAPDNFYHYLSGAILNDGFVINSKEHLEALIKEWTTQESEAIARKQDGSQFDSRLSQLSPKYRKLNQDETNAIGFSLFAPK